MVRLRRLIIAGRFDVVHCHVPGARSRKKTESEFDDQEVTRRTLAADERLPARPESWARARIRD